MEVYINPMLAAGVLKMTEPDNPTSRNQMYVTAEEAPEHGEAWACGTATQGRKKEATDICRILNSTPSSRGRNGNTIRRRKASTVREKKRLHGLWLYKKWSGWSVMSIPTKGCNPFRISGQSS